MRHLQFLAGVAIYAAATPQGSQSSFAIRDVRVFDGERAIPRATVVIDKGVITAVGADAIPPPGAEIIDGTGRTLIPGLIDAHTHTRRRAELETALAFGVTTRLHMYTLPAFADEMRREQIATGAGARADLYSAVTVVTTAGGHGSRRPGSPPLLLSSAADADAFVEARVAEGSDYIKIVVDDGSAYGKQWPTLTPATVAAEVGAAHKRQRLAVVHVARLADAREALRGGADGFVHVWLDGTPDAEFLSELQRRRAFVVPTLAVWRSRIGGVSATAIATDPRLQPFLPDVDALRLKTPGALKQDPDTPAQFERRANPSRC